MLSDWQTGPISSKAVQLISSLQEEHKKKSKRCSMEARTLSYHIEHVLFIVPVRYGIHLCISSSFFSYTLLLIRSFVLKKILTIIAKN